MPHQQTHEEKKSRKKWGLGLWLARKELAGIVVKSCYSNWSSVDEVPPRFLLLLRRHPKLASERFLRHNRRGVPSNVYPLSLLMELGARVSIVKEVFEMYPEALKEPVNQNSSSDFPLHLACQIGRVSPKVIRFLARAAPEFVSQEDSCYHLPLHSILRNPGRSAAVSEVEALLDIYEGALEKNCGFGTPITVALKSMHTTRSVLELLLRRLSNTHQWGDTLHIPGDKVIKCGHYRCIPKYDRNSTIALLHAEAISVILPHIRTFSCHPSQWQPQAFLHLMQNLKVQNSLVDLSLHMPPSLLCQSENICDSVQQLLEENVSLKFLHIDFGFHPFNEERQNIAGAIQPCMKALVRGLHHNTSLEECYLSGDVLQLVSESFLRIDICLPIAKLLQETNVTLTRVAFAHLRYMKVPPLESELLRYWLGLNRYGREKARNPDFTIQNLISIILNIANETVQHELDTVNFLYGLLRECPGLWSNQC
jgi:hypothetical protein